MKQRRQLAPRDALRPLTHPLRGPIDSLQSPPPQGTLLVAVPSREDRNQEELRSRHIPRLTTWNLRRCHLLVLEESASVVADIDSGEDGKSVLPCESSGRP